ncbi:MAG: RNA 2',3'-cyclic phosphodiesterase [Christensenellales bacterium]|jgi:2'-5' RNA ligase
MRLFVAIEPDEASRRAAFRAACIIRDTLGGRATRPENLHATVRFLGECQPGMVFAICDAMRASAREAAPFSLALHRADCFRRGGELIAFARLAGDIAALRRLHARLEQALADIGIPPDNRPLEPHMTLARRVPARCLPALSETPVEPAAFLVRHITLMESARGDGRLIYTPLERVSLAASLRSVVDRVEGPWAVCRAVADSRECLYHTAALPPGLKEGDVLDVGPDGIRINNEETERRRLDAQRWLSRWKQ